MKKYKVVLHPEAETDIDSSFQWGCHTWGEENARVWIRELRKVMTDRLTSMPLSCPRAPESEELGVIVRQLIVGRYRILFIIEKRTVTVLHVKGSYVGGPLSGE
jgi:plasmid stabilization system protein ParE